MSGKLSGKTAVVTAAAQGIGEAVVKTLAREGANVVLNGFGDAGQIEELRQTLGFASMR